MFYEIFKFLCEKNNTNPTTAVKILGLSTAMPTNWKNGQVPNADTLIKIADFFNVSTDYLLGRENKKTESTILAYSGNERIDSIAKEILKTDLSEDDLKLIEFILEKYKK